jgi:hypothetical protein
MHFAFSILGHGAYSPPQESEFQALQFRKARVEEDGFVDTEEALAFWKPDGETRKDIRLYCEQNFSPSAFTKTQSLEKHEDPKRSFLNRCILLLNDEGNEKETLQRKLLLFANAIASAVGFEVFELGLSAKSLELAKGTFSLGLEKLAHRDPRVGARILMEENWQLVFQTGTAITDYFRAETISALQRIFGEKVEQLKAFHETRAFGKALLWVDQELNGPLESVHCDLLKGLFNRFPLSGDLADSSSGSDNQGLEIIHDYFSLRVAYAKIEAVLAVAEFLNAKSSVELIHYFEAMRSCLILSTRQGDEKTFDWGLKVTKNDISRWEKFSTENKATTVYRFLNQIQDQFPTVEKTMLAKIIGEAVGGSEFSLMQGKDLFYAFG